MHRREPVRGAYPARRAESQWSFAYHASGQLCSARCVRTYRSARNFPAKPGSRDVPLAGVTVRGVAHSRKVILLDAGAPHSEVKS